MRTETPVRLEEFARDLEDHLQVAEATYRLIIPSSTARIQEMHLLMPHLLSEYIDARAVGTDAKATPGE